MVFNSWTFLVFFVVVYLLYLRLNHSTQNWMLLIASYIFYGWWDYRFLALLFTTSTIDYLAGLAMAASQSKARRKLFLVISMTGNLALLGFFKYYDFFAGSLNAGLHSLGINANLTLLKIVLPVGISFYTFKSMGYSIEVYFRRIEVCRNLRDYFLFVGFFPQLLAGPIERAKNLITQVVQPRVLTPRLIRSGLWLVLEGFFMKVFIADNAAILADKAFSQPDPTGAQALLGIYAFAVQIYGDFAGYSQIARGLANLMGFEFMLNFRQPYLAVNPSDFWSRWHISLSTWFRDYVFLQTAYGVAARLFRETYWGITAENIVYVIASLATMGLCGLWHGAAWKFVIWGLYQGLLLVIFRMFPARRPTARPVWWQWPLKAVAYFQLTCFGWLIFRCDSMSQVVSFPKAIVTNFAFHGPDRQTLLALLFMSIPLLVIDLCNEFKAEIGAVAARASQTHRSAIQFVRIGAFTAAVTSMLVLIFLAGVRGGHQFIYFQF